MLCNQWKRIRLIPSLPIPPIDGLGFMGKMWDHGVPGVPFWKAALRVAKPGAMLLAFGGTRTSHRLACAIEDAGWEIRDSIIWLYASGFPKSANISKLIDKATGKEREVTGPNIRRGDKEAYPRNSSSDNATFELGRDGKGYEGMGNITAPATDAAALWEGWGTALAPSHEPIITAMKPREGTFANNALTHGVAGLWIDGGRILAGQDYYSDKGWGPRYRASSMPNMGGHQTRPWVQDAIAENRPVKDSQPSTQGRWPKNTIFTHHPDCVERGTREVGSGKTKLSGHNRQGTIGDGEIYQGGKGMATIDYGLETVAGWDCRPNCPVRILAEQSGVTTTGNVKPHKNQGSWKQSSAWITGHHKDDTGTAARFFYCAKASRKERNLGLEGEGKKVNDGRQTPIDNAYQRGETLRLNTHPTVKPLSIMRYLCKLTKTPFSGVVFDPFMGSGTTGMAAVLEGRDFIGIEISEEYLEIARRRIAWAEAQPVRLL